MTTPTKQLLTITATARALGRERKTIHNWLRAGCPHHNRRLDLAEVKAWAIHRKHGPALRHMVKAERDARAGTKPPAPDPGAQTRAELAAITAAMEHPEGITGAIARLRAMEKSAFGLFADAHRANDAEAELTRSKLHSDITGHLLKAESLRDQTAELDRACWADVQKSLVAWAEPIRGLLSQAPRYLSARVNPLDPATGEAALRDWINGELFPALNRQPTNPNQQEKKQ